MSNGYTGPNMPPPPAPNPWGPAAQPAPRGTPWLKILGCGCLILILGFVGLIGGGMWWAGKKAPDLLMEIKKATVDAAKRDVPERADEIGTKFDQVAQVLRDGRLGFFAGLGAFGTVTNRAQAATNDGHLNDQEVDHLFLLLDDIIKDPEHFDMNKYPGGK